jgi:hypothetical protein
VGARVGDRDRLGDCQSRWGPASFRHAACPYTSVTGPNFSHPERGEPLPKGFESCQGGRLNLLLSHAGWRAESWVDALPRMLEPMGVQSHRALTGCEARRVIQTTQIHIAVVDLALPLEQAGSASGGGCHEPDLEEGGPRLLEILSRLDQPPPTVVVKRARSSRDDARDINAALRLGAFAVVDRPRHQSDVDLLLEVLRRALVRYYKGRWPGV